MVVDKGRGGEARLIKRRWASCSFVDEEEEEESREREKKKHL